MHSQKFSDAQNVFSLTELLMSPTVDKCLELGVEVNLANQAALGHGRTRRSARSNQVADEEEDDDDNADSDYAEEEAKESSSVTGATRTPKVAFAETKTIFGTGDEQHSYLLSEKALASSNLPMTTTEDDTEKQPPVLTPPRQIGTPIKSSASFLNNLSPAFRKMSLDDNESISTKGSTKGDGTEVSTKLSSLGEEGTESHPWIDWMNLEHPERNRDFEGHFVVNMNRFGWKRPAIHIRKHIVPMDMEFWTAFVPEKGKFPMFRNRCVMIKRPAFDFYQRNPDKYHDKLTLGEAADNCQAVFEAHTHYIEQGDLIEYVYHLLVFAESIVLDSAHFAGDNPARVVETQHNTIKLEKNDSSNEFGKDICSNYAMWEIAFLDGGIKMNTEKKKKKINKKNMFS